MAAKKAAKKKSGGTKKAALKDPQGGLTAAGRAHFKKTEGASLKPGVKKSQAEMTPQEMRRKGSFLRRHYVTLRGPLVDDKGKPTRLALQAHAWGEPVPKTEAAAKKLADKGERLLKKYEAAKAKQQSSKKPNKKSGSKTGSKKAKS